MVKIFLDAREMAHPEPLVQSVEHLKDMDEHHYFYMLNTLNPLPLLDIAKNNGFHTLSREDSKGLWHILISKERIELEALLDV